MFIPKITAVISFCSNDFRFLKPCVEGVAPFCEQILVTFCDHFFDGSEENYALLEEAFRQFPQCTFLGFNFDSKESYRPFSPIFPDHPDWRHEWHNTGRALSWFYSDCEHLFFIDCDEIVDVNAFAPWLKNADLQNYDTHRFAAYFYFREAKFVATNYRAFSLLVKKASLKPDDLWNEDERSGIFYHFSHRQAQVCGVDGQPMIHHYSGVRTKEEFLKKCITWGHHWERNWSDLIEKEYSGNFNGVDFIRSDSYREIEPHFDPLQVAIPDLPRISLQEHRKNLASFLNVVMVSKAEVFKKQLEYDFLR